MGSYAEEPLVDVSVVYHDWRDQLIEHGFVVLKNVVSAARAQHYLDSLFAWLETFPHGFHRENRSTWGPAHLPGHIKGGMYHDYAVSHERFFWEARTEPKVLEAFATLWGTDELLVSFDGANLTLPAAGRAALAAWPHVDQSPLRRGLQCVQGILNLAANGPRDGGLVVLRGSSALSEQFFREHGTAGGGSWGPADWHGFSDDDVAWFTARGCEVVKVCAEPGDLVLWDSRTVHYSRLPESDAVRSVLCELVAAAVAVVTCRVLTAQTSATPRPRTPLRRMSRRRKSSSRREEVPSVLRSAAHVSSPLADSSQTHWPHANIFSQTAEPKRLGKTDTYVRTRPVQEPRETEQVLKLAGVMPY